MRSYRMFLLVVFIVMFRPFAFGQIIGANMSYPIDLGTLSPGQSFTDTKNNNPVNGYGNDYGQGSDDIFYKFVLSTAGEVSISTCGSNFDTYLHLLNSSGVSITSNDDNGPLCAGLQSSIKIQLNAGTYYVVSEGYYLYSGNIITNISLAATPLQVNTDFATQMGQVFGNLESNRVPYGLLRDIALEQANLENYDGVLIADSNFVSMSDYKAIYQTILSAKINSSAGNFVPPNALDSIGNSQRQPGRIVLSGLYYKYSKFTDDAVANNRISVTNNVIYDKYNSGSWQNPYETKTAFAVAPISSVFEGKTQQFLLPANLWMLNSASDIASIQFDAGDGAGFRNITIGQTVSVTYADTGRKQVTFKLNLVNSTSIVAHHKFIIVPTVAEAIPDAQVFPITTSETYAGIPASGYMTIKLANPALGLRKPLIVVEGFDPGLITNPDQTLGLSNIVTFFDDIGSSGSNLISILRDLPQYDIVYLDYRNGTDDIKRNALLFKQVIREVNIRKAQAGSTTPNVVLGQSMGGLVARWGLKDMENNSEDHQTNLFISYDSPHQGANVPLGYQFLFNHLKSLYLRTSVAPVAEIYSFFSGKASLNNVLSLASQPAARQMLINYVNSSNQLDNSVHNSWQNDLKVMGYPAGFSGRPIRNVSVSNGAECAVSQPATPDSYLLNYTGKGSTTFLGDLGAAIGFPFLSNVINQPGFILGAIPGKNTITFDVKINTSANGGGNRVYYNKITYTKKILYLINVSVNIANESRSAPSGVLAYDSYAGGYYNTGVELHNSAGNNFLGKYNITADHQPIFGFVPTPSALDIGAGNTVLTDADYKVKYVGSNPPVYPKNTPFVNFTTAATITSQNEPHIRILSNNGNFVAAELVGPVQQQGDCTIQCGEVTISGPAQFCTSGSYSIPLPPGNFVTWSISGPATLSGANVNPVTLTKTGIGTVTLTATVNNSCGTYNGIPPLYPYAGLLPLSGTDHVDRTPQPSGYQYLSSSVTPPAGGVTVSSYTWYQEVNNMPTTTVLATGPSLSNYPLAPGQVLYFRCDAQTSCGPTSYRSYAYNTNGPAAAASSFAVYPNPSSSTLSVSQDQTVAASTVPVENTAAVSTLSDLPFEVTLFSEKGKALLKGKQTKKVTFNIQQIPNGIYYLHIKQGETLLKKQIIIQH